MKLMQLNAWAGRLEKPLHTYLEKSSVDIACMQEIIDFSGSIGGLATPSNRIQKHLDCEYAYFSPLFTGQFTGRMMAFGNAVYSKFPLVKQETIFTRGVFKEDFDFDTDDYNIRALQHVTLDVKGKMVHILNHHGHHIDSHKNGDEETERQATQIRGYIRSLEGPVILCGDFNLSPTSKSIEIISSDLRNLSSEHRLTTTRSLLTTKNEVCDYIFINDEVKLNHFYMPDEIVSDHNALILDFDI